MDLNLFDDIDFDKAEDLFDSFLNSCDVVEHKYVEPSDLVISTITVTGGIGSLVNDEIIYNCLRINDDIIYLCSIITTIYTRRSFKFISR